MSGRYLGPIFVLLTLEQLQARTRTWRIQYQINFRSDMPVDDSALPNAGPVRSPIPLDSSLRLVPACIAMNKVAHITRHRIRSSVATEQRYARAVALIGGAVMDDKPLRDYLVDDWLPFHKVEVEPTTYYRSADEISTFIIPHLGDIPVCELTRDDLYRFQQELLRTPVRRGTGMLRKTTVIRIHSTLSSALQKLVETGRIPANPAWGSRPRLKKSERFEPHVWTPQQLRQFLDLVVDDDLAALWNLLALSGLRRGEGLALQWGDLAQRYTHVSVKRSISSVRGGVYLTTTKAAQGRRIDLATETIRALRKHRRRQIRRARTKGKVLKSSAPIFTSSSGGFLNLAGVTKRFRALVSDSELPLIRLHDLRHTHASHLLESGANLKAVQERLGHADPGFTMNAYVHMSPTIQRDAVKQLERFYQTSQ